jgi:hypothetical protein
LIKANDFNALSRRRNTKLETLSEIDRAAKDLLDALKEHMPERTGTTDRDSNFNGWKLEKAHSMTHTARNIAWYGNSDVTSAQGPERCHIELMKKIAHLTNNKDIFLCMMRVHARNSHVRYLQRSLDIVDSNGLAIDFHLSSDKCMYPCELAIRYPILQAALARGKLHLKSKVLILEDIFNHIQPIFQHTST